MLIELFWLAAGFGLLIVGGDSLVRGASGIAAAMKISPLVIGLTVVAFGTSAPELAVSVASSFAGQADIAVGNVVGSNIFNVLFILGLSALIAPLTVSAQLVRFDVPIMIAAAIAMLVCSWYDRISRVEGAILFGSLLVYTGWLIWQSRREGAAVQQKFEQLGHAVAHDAGPASRFRTLPWNISFVAVGLVLLVLGSNWSVSAATGIARGLGISELMIGLTIVAAGTSLPEVVTSLTAAIRGERDIAVGNVVGSNIFNVLGVAGLSAVVAPHGLPVSDAAFTFDLPVMLAVCVACLPIFFTGHLIARWEGGLFFVFYLAYVGYLAAATFHPDIARKLQLILLGFVAPLVTMTLGVGVLRAIRGTRQTTSPPAS